MYKNFAQKLLAVSLCMAVVLMAVPLGGQSVHVAAADEATLPNTMFITKDDLTTLCEETNGGTGLLATGTLVGETDSEGNPGTDRKIRINFGQRPENVTYYTEVGGAPNTADAGPTTWLVAGGEKFVPEGRTEETNGLVLYSEEPLVSAYDLRDASSKMNSKFQPTYTDKIDNQYWVGSGADKTDRGGSDWGTYADADTDGTPDNPTNVYANHWGASNLRQVLNAIYNGSTLGEGDETADYSGFFNATEQGLMSVSEIKTNDHQTGSAVEYTTTDVLYAPRLISTDYSYLNNKSVTVGGADSLAVGAAHWGGFSWLRSPHPHRGYDALVALPGHYVSDFTVEFASPSISAAFRLNLSSVLFASAASSADGGEFSKIEADTPMTLRVHKYLPGTATLSADKKSITVANAAAGDVLMVQGVTDDGQNWSYSKTIDSTGLATVSAGDVVTACGSEITDFALSDFSKCNIWLERTTGEKGCTVTYASTPIVAGATDSTTHAGCTITSELEKPATCTEPGHQAHYKCSVCGQLFSDAEGNSPITEPEEIPAHGLTHVEEKAATCAEAGHKEYWQCKDTTCNKLFSDKAGTKPIDAPTQVAALEHKWDDGVVATQPTTSAPGVKTYKCSVCGHTRTETIPKLDWGSPMTRADGKTQYVVDDPSSPDHGKTSIEIKEDNLSQGDILWLLEESDGTSAWYGVDLSSGAFDLDNGLRFYVQWLSPTDPEYNTYYSQLDDAQKARVEGDNGWIFLIGVEDPAGNKVQPSKPVSVYVQIGDDWDVDDLNAYYITSGGDENVPVDYLMVDYPNGTDTFGRMTLSHFSPYFIFDELTDAERAALGIPSTGDISTELLISGLAIVLVSSLGVMLRLITSKKKFEE